jgi:hypothetical protein
MYYICSSVKTGSILESEFSIHFTTMQWIIVGLKNSEHD